MPNKKSGQQQKKQQAKRARRSAQRKENAKKIAARERHNRALEIKRQRRAEFPDFMFWEEHGNPEFVATVKEAIRRFDFAELDKVEHAFRMMKKFGATETLAAIRKHMCRFQEKGEVDAFIASADISWLCSVGHAVLSHIPDAEKRSFLTHE